MSESNVRRAIMDLQKDLSAHPELLNQFSSTPRLVLQRYGLNMESQRKLALDGDNSATDKLCLCGSYLSILTTITTFQPEQELN